MENIGFKKTRSGNLSLHAKGSGHDDIPDALALACWALPDTEGSTMKRKRGMKEPMILGGLDEDDDGNRYLSFDMDEDEDETLERYVIRTQ